MRPNKYDGITANRLCQDCVPPDVFSAGASERNDYYLQSLCNSKYLRVKNGSVFADDNWQNGSSQNFTFIGMREADGRASVTIYSKETNSYICFGKVWRPKSPEKPNIPKRCFFYESLDKRGAFRYQSIQKSNRFLGFQKNGKPIWGGRGANKPGGGGRKKHLNDEKCYQFERSNANASVSFALRNKQQQQQQQQQQQANHPPQQQQRPARRPPPPPSPNRQQDTSRKGTPGGGGELGGPTAGAANSLQLHRIRHKHGAGTGGRRGGGGKTLNPPVAPTLSNLATENNGGPGGTLVAPFYAGYSNDPGGVPTGSTMYTGKGGHRRLHQNSHIPSHGGGQGPSARSVPSATLQPLDAGGGLARKDRHQAIGPTGGGVETMGRGGGGGGGHGRKKHPPAAVTTAGGGRNGASATSAAMNLHGSRARERREVAVG